MDCSGCTVDCCAKFHVTITPDEYDLLKQINPDVNTKDIGPYHWIVPPCSFLSNSRCTIYSRRPIMCRLFPLSLQKSLLDGLVLLVGNSECPRLDTVTVRDKLYALHYIGKIRGKFPRDFKFYNDAALFVKELERESGRDPDGDACFSPFLPVEKLEEFIKYLSDESSVERVLKGGKK